MIAIGQKGPTVPSADAAPRATLPSFSPQAETGKEAASGPQPSADSICDPSRQDALGPSLMCCPRALLRNYSLCLEEQGVSHLQRTHPSSSPKTLTRCRYSSRELWPAVQCTPQASPSTEAPLQYQRPDPLLEEKGSKWQDVGSDSPVPV